MHNTTRRGFLGLDRISKLAKAQTTGRDAPGKGQTKPNIVFIMADDLGYECLGCNGGSSYDTPQLDALAASGVRFTNSYSTPLCTPSRVQVLTGQYPFRTGWTRHIQKKPRPKQWVDPALLNFATLLKSAGYATAVAGKWQLARFDDHPQHVTQCGFDEHCMWVWQYGPARQSRYWHPFIWQNGQLNTALLRDDIFGPDIYADFLVDFIRRHQDKSFFAYYPMTLPHLPLIDPPAHPKGQTKEDQFAAMVAYLDLLVGKIVAVLTELGLREQTLIIFTADNGTPRSIVSKLGDVSIPGGKGTMTDAGSHVPLIANWPTRILQSRVCEDLVDLSDILPTFAEISQATLPAGHRIDGVSFFPQLQGQIRTRRRWVFIQKNRRKAIRTHDWKLLNNGKLYDLRADPFEQTRLDPQTESAQAQAVREELATILRRMR